MQAQGLVDHVLPSLVLKNNSRPRAGPCQPLDHLGDPGVGVRGAPKAKTINSYGEAEVFSVLAPFADTIRGRLKALPASYFLKLVCLRQDGRIWGCMSTGKALRS